MPKINMIKKSSDHGSQKVYFNPKDHDFVGTNETESIDDLIQQKLDLGHSIMHSGDDEFYVVYASKKTDGFAREVTEENWSKDMALNVFEKSQTKWEECVDNYFKFLLLDPDSKAELNAIAYDAICLPSNDNNQSFDLFTEIDTHRRWLRSITITKNGTSGKRKSHIWRHLCGNGKRYGKPSARIKQAVATYVSRNTPKKKW